MKKHKVRNILLIVLSMIVLAGAVCGYIFRKEIKFYYTSYRIELYAKKQYDAQRIDIEEVYPKKMKEDLSEEKKRFNVTKYRYDSFKYNTSFFADEDLSYYMGYKFNSRFDSEYTDYSFTDHSDEPYVCKKCFICSCRDEASDKRAYTQIMLFENNGSSDSDYDAFTKQRRSEDMKSEWVYVPADPISFYKYHGVTEYSGCFYDYEYYPLSDYLVVSITYFDKDMVVDGYYSCKNKEDLKEYLDALDSAGVPVSDEIRGLPDNIPPREE